MEALSCTHQSHGGGWSGFLRVQFNSHDDLWRVFKSLLAVLMHNVYVCERSVGERDGGNLKTALPPLTDLVLLAVQSKGTMKGPHISNSRQFKPA